MTACGPDLAARLRSARFRAHPGYALVAFDRLDDSERSSLEELRPDPDFYGILRPRDGSSGSLKRVDPDTALLLLSLEEPGGLPSFALARLGDDLRPIAQLLLDGLLEVERDGCFVSGPESVAALDRAPERGPARDGALAALSERAVRLAQDLPARDASSIALRLYLYNRLPATARRRRELGDAARVARALGLEREPLAGMLAEHWRAVDVPPPNDGWLVWSARRPRAGARGPGPTYKLYVSPHPEHLGPAFARMVTVLTARGAQTFKAGRDLGGVLRPDKLVAYFQDRAEMLETGRALVGALAGLRAQGVPFTAALDDAGLVSWGVDPERPGFQVPWLSEESWRMRVTQRLAAALCAARAAPTAELEPWQFALERMRAEGIDVATWAPEEAAVR